MSVTKHSEQVAYMRARLTNDRARWGWHIVRAEPIITAAVIVGQPPHYLPEGPALCEITVMSGQRWVEVTVAYAALPGCGKCRHTADHRKIEIK